MRPSPIAARIPLAQDGSRALAVFWRPGPVVGQGGAFLQPGMMGADIADLESIAEALDAVLNVARARPSAAEHLAEANEPIASGPI
jgi:hypothetical protein